MNQTAQTTEWLGDCVISVQHDKRTLVLDFQDLRAKKFADMRSLIAHSEEHASKLCWTDVFSSTWIALDQRFGKEWFYSGGEGQGERTLQITVQDGKDVNAFARIVGEFLRERTGIVVQVV